MTGFTDGVSALGTRDGVADFEALVTSTEEGRGGSLRNEGWREAGLPFVNSMHIMFKKRRCLTWALQKHLLGLQ